LIKAWLFVPTLLLAGCQRTSEQDAQLAALPAAAKVPQCAVMRVAWSSYSTLEMAGERLYRDTVAVTTTPDCIAKWRASFDGKDNRDSDVHGRLMYYVSKGRKMLAVGGSKDMVIIHWVHSSPTSLMHYVEQPAS
jgi:hypothetical protein